MELDLNNLSAVDTKRLNCLAERLMTKYTLFVDCCSRLYGENYLFWATPFASRNRFHDETFLSICRVLLALQIIKDNKISRIVPVSIGEYNVLRNIIGKEIDVVKPKVLVPIFRLRKLASILKNYIRIICEIFAYKIYAGKVNEYPKQITVLSGFVTSADLRNYYYNDNYMPGINRYYPDAFFFPIIINNSKKHFFDIFDQINGCSNYKFLVDRDLVHISDHIEIVKYWRCVKKLQSFRFYFEGIDVSSLVHENLEKGKNNSSSLDGLIKRKMIQRLKGKGIDVRTFVLWYEGQPRDIMISSTVRNEYPDAVCIGYQGRPLVENLQSEYISEYQFVSNHSPNKMAIPSRQYVSDARQFYPDMPLMFIPVLRNDYTLRSHIMNYNRKKTILLLLPYFEDVAKEEICLMDLYMRNKRDVTVLIKNHPTKTQYNLNDYGIDNLSFAPSFVSGKLADCLEGVDVVVASCTTAGFEMLFSGVPLIIICPRGELGFAALPKGIKEKMSYMVYGIDELENALDSCFSGLPINNDLLRDFFVSNMDD